jgi:branched-chain amino acid transport system substrate-binding protein
MRPTYIWFLQYLGVRISIRPHTARPKPWLLIGLALATLAVQCAGPTPPLPASPKTPPLQIALLLPTTGELATFGRMMHNGILMAVDEWNNQGGVLGHRLEPVIYDTGCAFQAGQQSTQQVIDDGLQFIVGPLCSEAAIAVAETAGAANVVVIAPTAIHPLVTVNAQGQTRPGVFTISYQAGLQGQAAASFARNTLKVDRAAMFFQPDDPYTAALSANFARYFTEAGGEIVYQSTYEPETTPIAELLTALHQADAQLLYLPVAPNVANQITGELASSPSALPNLLLLGSDTWESAELDRAAAQGAYFPVHFSPQAEQVQPWLAAYQSTFATEPSTLAVLGYDALHTLAQAIQQAGTLTPATVATTLSQGTFEAVTGPLTFTPDHTPLKPVPFVQVEGGELKYITSIPPKR